MKILEIIKHPELISDLNFLKKNKKKFEELQKSKFLSVEDVSDLTLARRFNYSSHNTGTKIRKIYNKYYK
jgi:hypothetical protein